ncbi:MAG TPA: hypothetical protein VJ752_04085 [Burkholderiaceae bacterium]|nr:hypothetical protein [Burkholderiaceae bacterium]
MLAQIYDKNNNSGCCAQGVKKTCAWPVSGAAAKKWIFTDLREFQALQLFHL